MTDASQEEISCLLEQGLPTGSALDEALAHLKEIGSEIRSAQRRIEQLAPYLTGLYYTDQQYSYASAEIIRLDKDVIPRLEQQRIAALTMLIDAHYPVSVHYR